MLTKYPVKRDSITGSGGVVHGFSHQNVIDVQSLSYHLLVQLGGDLVSTLWVPVETDQLVVDPHLLVGLFTYDHRVGQQTASLLDSQLGILEDAQGIAVRIVELANGLACGNIAGRPGLTAVSSSDIDSPNRLLEVAVGDDQLLIQLEHVSNHVGCRLLDGVALVGHVGDIGHEGHLEGIPAAHIRAGGINLEFSLGRDAAGSPLTCLVGKVILHSPLGIETGYLVHRYHGEPLISHEVCGFLPVGERPLRFQPGYVDL